MGDGVNIVIASPTQSFCSRLAEKINTTEKLHISAVVHDGNDALEACLRCTPDLLVTGLLLPNLDGIGLIRKLHENNLYPRIVVVSGFYNSDTAAILAQHGVGRFLPLPCDLDEIVLFAANCNEAQMNHRTPRSCEAEITDALLSCGVMPNLRGYRLLRSAVKIVIEDRDNLHGITKILYPDLAKLHNTSAKSVERSIRNAIDAAWRSCDISKRRSHFGMYAPLLESKPTNSEFISLLADFVESRISNFRDLVSQK